MIRIDLREPKQRDPVVLPAALTGELIDATTKQATSGSKASYPSLLRA